MMVTQKLASGVTIRQDFSTAVRPVFFQTDFEEVLYATHGGTLFVVQFRGIYYAITCGHVFQDFPHGRLFIANQKYATKGSMPAPVAGYCHPSAPMDGAVGTDVGDICLIDFTDELPRDFFKDSAYVIDRGTIATAGYGHALLVAGVLKDKTYIVPPDITIGYCNLQFRDIGPASDPFLRRGLAVFGQHLFGRSEFERITGISGAPVFDRTNNALCGMVMRGGMVGPVCHIAYVDAFDILKFLEAVHARADNTYYFKNVVVPR
jgi:hypothetical protein